MKKIFLTIIDRLNLFIFFNKFTKNTATIFMLHAIEPIEKETGEVISTQKLRTFFEYLKQHNYKVLSLSEYIDALINNKETFKAVVFTVDDGYRDFYENAYEVFKEYNYPATIFITSDFIEGKLFFWWNTIEYLINNTLKKELDLTSGNLNNFLLDSMTKKKEAITAIVNHCKTLKNHEKLVLIEELQEKMDVDISDQPKNEYAPLSWEEIDEMNKCGIDFFPHTKTHPIMSKISYEQKMEELSIPKEVIEKRLCKAANIFCYPNGGQDDFDEETISVLKSLGYIAAVTGISGYDNTQASVDMYRIKRVALPSDFIYFKQYVSGIENLKRHFYRT